MRARVFCLCSGSVFLFLTFCPIFVKKTDHRELMSSKKNNNNSNKSGMPPRQRADEIILINNAPKPSPNKLSYVKSKCFGRAPEKKSGSGYALQVLAIRALWLWAFASIPHVTVTAHLINNSF
jgi:hypothetical protein